LLGRRQRVLFDFVETTQVSGKRMRFSVDCVTTQIFEQVVVRVDAVQGGKRWMGLMQISQKVVDEVG